MKILTPAQIAFLKKRFLAQMGQNLLTPAEFQAVQKTVEYNAGIKRIEQKERMEGNAQRQRWHTLTREEQARSAIDIMTGKVREFNDFKAGGDTTEEEARRKATEIALRADHEKALKR